MNNSFITTLQEFRNGESISELSDGLAQLLEAVNETGKGGKLIFELHVKPAANGTALVVTDKITVKEPVIPRDQAIFFATGDGRLVRQNPDQRNLDLKEVAPPAPTGPAKEIVAAAPAPAEAKTVNA